MSGAVVSFIPRVGASSEFVCTVCGVPTFRAISLDHFPICALCRWFCNVEGRWGRDHDGIKSPLAELGE